MEGALQTIRQNVTVKQACRARAVLSMSLNQAVRWEMVPRTISQSVKPPVLSFEDETNVRFWQPREVALFLKAMQSHRLHALFHTGFMTGMRPCELLGLRWQDVDLIAGLIRVEQDAVDVQGKMHIGSVKTKASRRKLTIPPDTVAALKDHRSRQNTERKNAAEGYRDQGLVFASEVGSVTEYHNLRRVLKTFIAQIVMKGWLD